MQLILCEISALDSNNLFYDPLPCDAMPNYRKVAKRPLSLTTIAAYVAATTTTTTVVKNNGFIDQQQQQQGLTEAAAASQCRSTIPYSWQSFEDDLVAMLTNCIAYNKVGSVYYVEAVRILRKLPEIFAKHCPDGGSYTYSRTKHCHTNKKAATAAPTTVTAVQLQQEALMLHFTALLANDLAGALTSVLLSSPMKAAAVATAHGYDTANALYNSTTNHTPAEIGFATTTDNGSPSFVFCCPANYLIPNSIEALRHQVMIHAFPSLAVFLRTVSLMLTFAIASTCDEEAVEILVQFQQKIEQQCAVFSADCDGDADAMGDKNQNSSASTAQQKVVRDSKSNTTDGLRSAIVATAASLRPVACEDVIAAADKDHAVRSAVANAVGASPPAMVVTSSSSSSSSSLSQSQLYEETIVNEQDAALRASALSLIASLAALDTSGSFQKPFLLSDYMRVMAKPCDLFTMKMKAVLGHYSVPFVGHLPDGRSKRAKKQNLLLDKETNEVANKKDNDTANNKGDETVAKKEEEGTDDTDNANADAAPTAAAGAGGDAEAAVAPAVTMSQQSSSSIVEIDYTILDLVRAAIRADVDVMVDNCTFFNGPDHELSRLVTDIRRVFATEARKCGL